nr:hypothetical protein KPHV_18720 [Kitasatospora purpeofusca]
MRSLACTDRLVSDCPERTAIWAAWTSLRAAKSVTAFSGRPGDGDDEKTWSAPSVTQTEGGAAATACPGKADASSRQADAAIDALMGIFLTVPPGRS